MYMANAYHSKEKYIQIAEKLRGKKRNLETKKKMSIAQTGRKVSPETIEKLRGIKRSLETRNKLSKAMKGRIPWNKGKTGIYSKETIEKIRIANLGKKRSLETKMKARDSMVNFFKSKDSSYIAPDYSLGENDRKYQSIRIMRLKKNGGHHTQLQWEFLKGAHNYQCRMCNKMEPEIKLTKDHIIPIRHGGNDDIQNIQPLCRSCNSKKR